MLTWSSVRDSLLTWCDVSDFPAGAADFSLSATLAGWQNHRASSNSATGSFFALGAQRQRMDSEQGIELYS